MPDRNPDVQAPQNFALIGVAGYVAPRHLEAIQQTGNGLIAAVDPHDSVGILDRYFPDAKFFAEIERFDRFLEKRRRSNGQPVEYVSICSPNYLHDAHVRLALRSGAHAICEKPLVINPWNLDPLAELEAECGRKVHTVLQLRLHPAVRALKKVVEAGSSGKVADVCLTYVTPRGKWYPISWKGSVEKSGGLATNIGIHFFDLLLWVFGREEKCELHLSTPTRMAGYLELERARVRWLLSVDGDDLPQGKGENDRTAYRSLTIDGEEVDFSDGFGELHTKTYGELLAGRGCGIEEARGAIELLHTIRTSDVALREKHLHPHLAGAGAGRGATPKASEAL